MKLRTLAASLVIMLAIIASDAHAQSSSCAQIISDDLASIFLMGIMISGLLVSLWYMIGSLMGSPEIEATTKNEFQQIGITLLLAVALRAVIPLLCGISIYEDGLGYNGGVSAMVVQTESKFQMLAGTILDVYLDMSNAIMDYSKLGSAYTGFSLHGVSVLLSPFGTHSIVASMIAPVSQSVLLAYFSIIFQYTIFKIAQSKVFMMLLPVGLVFRSFSLTRKFGGVLIAVSLGMSFIYPLMVTFGFEMAGGVDYSELDSVDAMVYIVPLSAAMLGVSLAGAIGSASKLGAVMGIATGSTMAASELGFITGSSEYVESDLASVYSSFGSIMLIAFFLPVLEVMLMAAAVRSISGALGTEVDISGIMRAV